jgi:hypothetical protein
MAPAFWSGDLVLIQSISEDYQNGDIVVFQNPDLAAQEYVIHRISSIDLDKIQTMGDNNNYEDDWTLEKEDIIGIAFTFNEKPIVAKKLGGFFIKDYEFDRNAKYKFSEFEFNLLEFLRNSLSNIHAYGPVYLVIIFMLIFLNQLTQNEKSKVY